MPFTSALFTSKVVRNSQSLLTISRWKGSSKRIFLRFPIPGFRGSERNWWSFLSWSSGSLERSIILRSIIQPRGDWRHKGRHSQGMLGYRAGRHTLRRGCRFIKLRRCCLGWYDPHCPNWCSSPVRLRGWYCEGAKSRCQVPRKRGSHALQSWTSNS